MRETVYADYAGGRWEYFTYADSRRVFIGESFARRMIRQGAKLVNAAGQFGRPPIAKG